MKINRQRITKLLDKFDFETLFIDELGWDYCENETSINIPIDDRNYSLTPIAHKRNLVVYHCPLQNDSIPLSRTLKKIDRQVSQYAYEHFIIYTSTKDKKQVWQWVKKELNQPIKSRTVTYSHYKKEDLLQKLALLYISLEEEDNLNLTDVKSKTKKAFDVDKVTKKFYDKFKKQHSQFLTFVEGITDRLDREWYASIMFNRLMFVYFIQKKGFLNNDIDYLLNKLNEIKNEDIGGYKFYSFYRYFLLKLFHDGLGKENRTKELNQLLGNIPYLNGGLFDIHLLEKKYPDLDIKDEAFEEVFNFFEQYNWHLDDRPLKQDNEINPDVLGYIFEKYINQKQMGAYYTKEDITEYISKNCIIPYLFDSVKQELSGYVYQEKVDYSLGFYLLQENPDRYIYDAVKKGVDLELPEEISKGINRVSERENWNTTADEEYALPTEIWREVVARRQRYLEVRAKLSNGEINSINDLITYNLNIRQFAEDVINNINSPLPLQIFYQQLSSMSILDPTCGSGAFLFAALNILEPLYDGCLERMQIFIDEEKLLKLDKKEKKIIKDFQGILANVRSHANRNYFILKNIMLNNLYGVDIMEEATEICKLRLFLKLASQVEVNHKAKNYGIEPLPDIDFNIRSGNSLVGFANYDEVKKAVEGNEQKKLDLFDDMGVINDKAKKVSEVYHTFKQIQTQSNGTNFKETKQRLQTSLNSLNEELNCYLAREYGIDLNKEKDYQKWLFSHQPFHWFTEYYGIINLGGFDVIIGNPPYVEYSKVRKEYQIKGYETEKCGNLYAFIIENSLLTTRLQGRLGMIVPVSLGASQRMDTLRKNLENNSDNLYYSSFADRPSCLFLGVHQILSICLVQKSKQSSINHFFSAGFKHWVAEERNNLLYIQSYIDVSNKQKNTNTWGKFSSYLELNILDKIIKDNKNITSCFSKSTNYILAISGGTGGYWLRCFDESQKSNEYKEKFVLNKEKQLVISAIINSHTFYWSWRKYSDCRHLTLLDLDNFFFNFQKSLVIEKLVNISNLYLRQLKVTKEIRKGKMTYEQYRPSKVKNLIDEIDKILAQHYGFTEEELDFIINYDIKYRMGKELNSD